MKYYDKKIGEIGPFEIIGTEDPRDNVGLRDRSGSWVISPELGYRSFTHYDDGMMIAYRSENDGFGWILVDYHGNRISDRYNFIEPAGEGYYMVEKGSRHNIMRRDGSLVLKEWPQRVWKVRGGYFQIEKTIRKTKTRPTRYIAGVAHVSGTIVFPMIFESVKFLEGPEDANMLAKIDGQPLIIHSGAVFDPQKRHYPPKLEPNNLGQIFEQIINWILPGLQMFYRDTDVDIDVEHMYPLGKVLRTGFYTSISTKLQRPAQKTRFLIASAHTALLCSDENGNVNEKGLWLSPKAEEWRHALISKNAWLKVLDVYRVGEVTQIFMIQIPETAALYFETNETVFNFVNEAGGGGTTLVDIARRNLDEKMRQSVHPRSVDPELISLMSQPVGYSINSNPYSIDPDFSLDSEPFSGRRDSIEHRRYFCQLIHNLAADADIVQDYDGFPWRGVVGSVCEGCMYANLNNKKPYGCGRLFQESYRKNYTSGHCDFWKFNLAEESVFEMRARMKREKEKEHKSKTSGKYAIKLLCDFIQEHLKGNLDNLLYFDFSTLKDDEKYGAIYGPDMVTNYAIVKAIIELAFSEYWPDLNVETLDQGLYRIGTIIHYQMLAGVRLAPRRFKALDAHCPILELIDLAEELHSQVNRLGDFMVWPNKSIMASMVYDYKMRGYLDRMFISMYEVMIDSPKQNIEIKTALYKNRKLMKNYQGKDGFESFMRNSLLDSFINDDGSPKKLFEGISNSSRDFRPEFLPSALQEYHDFMVPTIEYRSLRMIKKLKEKIKVYL